MKNIFYAVVFTVLTASTSQAWESVQANVLVSNSSVSATVVNNWGMTVVCRGRVYAQTASGIWGNVWMNSTIILPGMNAYVNANANNPYADPIINGYAEMECQASY